MKKNPGTVSVAGIPRDLMEAASAEYPGLTNPKVITCVLADYLGWEKSVSPEVDQNRRFTEAAKIKQASSDIAAMRKTLAAQNRRSAACEQALAFLILDRLGLRQKRMTELNQLDFAEPGILSVCAKLEEQAPETAKRLQEERARAERMRAKTHEY